MTQSLAKKALNAFGTHSSQATAAAQMEVDSEGSHWTTNPSIKVMNLHENMEVHGWLVGDKFSWTRGSGTMNQPSSLMNFGSVCSLSHSPEPYPAQSFQFWINNRDPADTAWKNRFGSNTIRCCPLSNSSGTQVSRSIDPYPTLAKSFLLF